MTERRTGPPDLERCPPTRPATGTAGSAKSDDDLLFEIERLPAGHDADAAPPRGRAERAPFLHPPGGGQEGAESRPAEGRTPADRHIGQILVRGLNRTDDVAYLERLLVESRHVEVKKAAEAQLRAIATAKTVPRRS